MVRRIHVPPADSESEITFAPLFQEIDLKSEQLRVCAGFHCKHLFILALAWQSVLGLCCPKVLGRRLVRVVFIGEEGVRQTLLWRCSVSGEVAVRAVTFWEKVPLLTLLL